MKNLSKSTNLMIKIGLLSAIALLLVYLEFPILPGFTFLKIDLGDIPPLIGAFTFGPLAGAVIEGLKNILILLVKGTQTGGVGELANFVVGCFFVCTAAIIYRRNKTKKTAVIAMIISTIVMTVAGVISNYLVFVPLYFKGMPSKDITHYMVYGIVPFNLIKGTIISIVTLVIYKRVSVIIHSEGSSKKNSGSSQKSA